MKQERRIYRAIEPVQAEDAEAALKRNDPAELLLVAIAVGLHSEELAWSEEFCLRLARHPHFNVRGNAILSLGHLARRFKKLNRAESIETVRGGLADADEYVRGHADSAADDIESFAKLNVRQADGAL
jgi:hypothetical protein